MSGNNASDAKIVLTGLSEPIDRNYLSAHADVPVLKPAPGIHPELGSIIGEIQNKRVQGWTTAALDLLRIGDLDEQTKLLDAVASLRRKVKKAYRDPKHTCSVAFAPHNSKDSCILFYVYPEALREKRHENVRALSTAALDELKRKRCVIVGRQIEAWDRPYGFIGLAYQPCSDDKDAEQP